MKKNPLISIITINRNNKDELRKTIESVVTQSGFKPGELEYIIIDGASTDGSVEVIKEFAAHKKYGKIIKYWVSEPDTGIYNAMNKGIKQAHAPIVGLMNSGDRFLPDVLYKIPALAENNPDTILCGALKAIENGKFVSISGFSPDLLPQQMVPHASSFVPLKLYQKYNYYDETYKITGDYDLFLHMYTSGEKFKFIDLIINEFNLEGISQTAIEKTAIEKKRVQVKYGTYIEPDLKHKIKNLIKKIFK